MKNFMFILLFMAIGFVNSEEWSRNGCGYSIHDEEGIVASPRITTSTEEDFYCEWRISTLPQTEILVSFLSFSIPYHEYCKFGFVEIYIGNDNKHEKVNGTKLCGELDIKNIWELHTNSMLVIFYASKYRLYQGFTLEWESKDLSKTAEFELCGQNAVIPEFVTKFLKNLGGTINSEENRYTNASEGSWPWQAFINLGNTNYKKICQATILYRNVVITAAHCVENDILPDDLYIFVGKHLSSVWEATEQKLKVEEIHIHSKRMLARYLTQNSDICDYDLALLVLENDITFSPYIQPACLHLSGAHSRLCIATGWNVQYTITHPEKISLSGKSVGLKELEISFYEVHTCDLLLAGNGYIHGRFHNFLCGTSGDLGDYTRAALHEGDSGAPIVCYQNEHWELVAVHVASMWYHSIGKIVHLFMKVNNPWVKSKLGLGNDLLHDVYNYRTSGGQNV